MRNVVLIGFVVLWGTMAIAATPLSNPEKHRLASYLAYIVVGVEAQGPGGGSIYTVGANCPECNGVGKVGDGVTMLTCEWSDGLYYCNKGKVAQKSAGDSMEYEVDDAMCETVCDCACGCGGKCGGQCGCDNCNCATPQRDELFDDLDNAPKRAGEGYVRKLEEQLTQALQEVETLRVDPETCQPVEEEELLPDLEPEPEPVQQEVSSDDVLTIYKMPNNTRWNWNGRSNPSTEYMRSHLAAEHGIDTSGMNRDQLQIVHNNAHNYGDAMALGSATYSGGGGCPDGQCPTSSGSSSGGGCPGGNCPTSGSSRSRGLFGRWR